MGCHRFPCGRKSHLQARTRSVACVPGMFNCPWPLLCKEMWRRRCVTNVVLDRQGGKDSSQSHRTGWEAYEKEIAALGELDGYGAN